MDTASLRAPEAGAGRRRDPHISGKRPAEAARGPQKRHESPTKRAATRAAQGSRQTRVLSAPLILSSSSQIISLHFYVLLNLKSF